MNTLSAHDFSSFYTPRSTLRYILLNLLTASLFSIWWQVNLVKEVNRRIGAEACDIRWYWGFLAFGSWASLPCLYAAGPGGIGFLGFITLAVLLSLWITFALSVAAVLNRFFEQFGLPARASRLWTAIFGSYYQYYLLFSLQSRMERQTPQGAFPPAGPDGGVVS